MDTVGIHVSIRFPRTTKYRTDQQLTRAILSFLTAEVGIPFVVMPYQGRGTKHIRPKGWREEGE